MFPLGAVSHAPVVPEPERPSLSIAMAIFDKPPAEVPAEVLVGASVCLGFGMMFWMLSNIFMAHRSFESCATPAPILAVGLNLAWTTVYAMYIAHTILEYLLLALWIASLLPVVYALIANGPHTYGAGSPAARFMPLILGGVFMAGVAVDFLFVRWWLSEAHRGHGHKAGKSWRGQEDRDTSELTWWTLGLVQLCYSAGAVYLLKRRGHSGGQSHFIWYVFVAILPSKRTFEEWEALPRGPAGAHKQSAC